ncbi:MAG: cysteine desulfurase family protein [Oscillospiraceae bacterium]
MEIYLDNCATTKVCQEAANACMKVMTVEYGNPSSLHKKGLEAENILTDVRKSIGLILNGDPDCVLFTGGATESNNLAILGGVSARKREGKTIVTTSVEHASVENAVALLEQQGYTIKRVSPKADGNFDAADFVAAVDDDTVLLTFMMVNNEIGTFLPYEKIVSGVRKKYPKLLIHMDAVQGFTKFPLHMKKVDIDLLSFSGHKLYAPKGIGGLYLKKGVRIHPLLHGGGQERGLRSGTQSVPLIAAMGAALTLCKEKNDLFFETYRSCNAYLRQALLKIDGVVINSPENGSPHLLNFSIPGVPSEIMLHYLEQHEIYVSSGSACSKGAKSSVLEAYGFPTERIISALRISFSKDTTKEELDCLIASLKQGIQKFKAII